MTSTAPDGVPPPEDGGEAARRDPRAARSEQTLAAVVETALQLAIEGGLQAVSFGEVARRLGISKSGAFVRTGSQAALIGLVLDEYDRPGKLEGKGFYEYNEEGRRTGLWRGLWDELGAGKVKVADGESTVAGTGLDSAAAGAAQKAAADPSGVAAGSNVPADAPAFIDLVERPLFAEALETQKCIDEGVLTSDADANIGSIMGIGFPAWTGGVAQYIDGYPGGLPGFVERARILAKAYGDRFAPPASLVEKAEKGQNFRDSV